MRNPGTCANCGSQAESNYCPQCGQKTDIRHRHFRKILGDMFSEIFSLDNSLFRSLKPLLFQPGKLTAEYIAGRRIRYIPPFRLFLFSVFLFVFTVSVIVPPLQSSFPDLYGGNSQIKVNVTTKSDETTAEEKQQAEKEFSEGMLASLQFVMIFMAPVFALMLAAVHYKRKDFYFIDHFVFSLHFHAFIFLYLSIVNLIPDNPFISIILLPPFFAYPYIASRRVYGGKWWVTLITTPLLLLLYSILVFFILIVVSLLQNNVFS